MIELSEESKRKAVAVCPRCGLPVSWFEEKRAGERTYIYAVHYLGYANKRKRVRKCYLGPSESYEYVSRLHLKEGLELYGLTNPDRVFEYANALLTVLPEAVAMKIEKEPKSKEQVAQLLQKMLKTVDEIRKLLSQQ